MKRASIVLICYLLSLLVFSLFFSWLGVKEFKPNPSTLKTLQHPMMLVTIITGLIALRFAVTARSFKIFLIVYVCLWLLRIPVNFTNNQIAENLAWYKKYGVNRFTFKYYDSVTRICTPLPFIIYWFIMYFFDIVTRTFVKGHKPTGSTEPDGGVVAEQEINKL